MEIVLENPVIQTQTIDKDLIYEILDGKPTKCGKN